MSKTKLLLAITAVALTWAVPAGADVILFNPTGGGATGAVPIDTLDQAPGNAIAEGVTVNTAPTFLQNGQSFPLLYQANLQAATLLGVPTYQQGDLGKSFTFTAQFNETVTAAAALGSGFVLQFGLDGSSTNTNLVSMYAHNGAGGDNLSGLGFNTGQLILQGRVVNAAVAPGPPPTNVTFSDVFSFNCISAATTCAVPLDQAGATNNYPGINTLPGIGSANIPVQLTFADPGYFPTLSPGSVLTFAVLSNVGEALPFGTADPSAVFFNGNLGVGDVGTMNGLSGPDTQLLVDASNKFALAPTVPEPATLTLFGLGLIGGVRRLRRKKN